jgi:hypothetical protein
MEAVVIEKVLIAVRVSQAFDLMLIFPRLYGIL